MGNSPLKKPDHFFCAPFAARDLRVPMTVLNDRLVEDSLSRICETPAKIIPVRKTDNQDTA